MNLVEVHNIDVNHSLFKECDSLCFDSKNLYNKALYIVRQEFIKTKKETGTGNYLNYYVINRIMIDSKDIDYYKLPTRISNATLMKLDKNWKGFFASMRDWKNNPSKYKGMPRIPKYLKKESGRFLCEYEPNTMARKKLKDGIIKLSGTNIEIPFINHKDGKLKQVRIVPTCNNMYKIEVVYEVEAKDLELNKENILGIDLGVGNLLTLTSNKVGFQPIIINGGIVKSENQFYNKKRAKMQAELPKGIKTSKSIKKLTLDRENRINSEFHNVSKFIVELCKKHDIGVVAIGKNKHWKQDINIGSVNNQNFVGIPYNKLIHMIEYKSELIGNEVIVTEEAHTSKASFLDLDEIPSYKKGSDVVFSGKRIKRGLYKSKNGTIINADVNGSYNIIRKVLIKKGKTFPIDMIDGVAVHPVRIKSTKHFHKFL